MLCSRDSGRTWQTQAYSASCSAFFSMAVEGGPPPLRDRAALHLANRAPCLEKQAAGKRHRYSVCLFANELHPASPSPPIPKTHAKGASCL